MPQVKITLAQIKAHRPPARRFNFKTLVKSLGGIKAYGEDTPITFEQIIESNGFEDALWALKALSPEHSSWLRHFAVDCAESVKEYMTDKRSLDALRLARRYADGLATDKELKRAQDSAWAAAGDAQAAAWAARAAARAASWSAKDAACDAAWDATMAAARAASWASADAARTAAWTAAWNAADAARAAARAAAWASADAARDAAWDAKGARAARDAARAAAAAVDAAWVAILAGFQALLLEYTRTGKRVMNAQEIISKARA